MRNLKHPSLKPASLLSIAALALTATTASGRGTSDDCGPASVIPLTGSEAPAKIVIHPPLPGRLVSRGVAIIEYCARNRHLVPVFSANALDVSPRIGHVHVKLDDAPWV